MDSKNFFNIVSEYLQTQAVESGKTPTEERQIAQALFMQGNTVNEPVDSTALDELGYDPASRVMDAVFYEGSEYQYLGVSPEIAEGWMEADSKGEYLNQVIKRGFFPFVRIV
jgi:hypothetical protein